MLSGTPRTPPTGVRWYLDAVNYPNTTGYSGVFWPSITAEFGSPAHALVSIRPDLERLLSGTFDADLIAFMQSAPAGRASLLTMWHEAATISRTNRRYPQKPALFRQGLSYLRDLAAGTDVKVGVVDINPGYLHDPAAVYAQWMVANLDWYGCDLYDNKTLDLPVHDELNAFRGFVNTLPGSIANADWPICLPECNSRTDPATGNSTVVTSGPTGYRRSDFFHDAWAWLRKIGPGGHSCGLLGFWGGTGGDGSPWPPADTPTGSLAAMIAELNAENAQSSP